MRAQSNAKNGRARWLPLGIFLGLLALSPVLSRQLNPYDYSRGGLDEHSPVAERNSNAFAVLLGEFRTSLSDLMMIKTELYLHKGVAYMPHLNYDEMAQTGEAGEKSSEIEQHDHEHHEEDEGESASTVIPPPEADFRGPIGELHRRVKPWQDPDKPHELTSGEELLPWYRVMTISDPQNVRAYLIGSWWLKSKMDEVYLKEALEFVNEGIAENPRAFQLYLMQGYIYSDLGEDENARESYLQGAQLVERLRPPNGAEHPDWTESQEEDARAVCRMAVIMEGRLGEPKKALEMALRYNQLLGGDGRLQVAIGEIHQELSDK